MILGNKCFMIIAFARFMIFLIQKIVSPALMLQEELVISCEIQSIKANVSL